MLRFRHFTGVGPELDRVVNEWIQLEEPDIRFMSQSGLSDGGIGLCLVYEEGFAAQERRMTREHGLERGEPPPPSARERRDIPLKVPTEPGPH